MRAHDIAAAALAMGGVAPARSAVSLLNDSVRPVDPLAPRPMPGDALLAELRAANPSRRERAR